MFGMYPQGGGGMQMPGLGYPGAQPGMGGGQGLGGNDPRTASSFRSPITGFGGSQFGAPANSPGMGGAGATFGGGHLTSSRPGGGGMRNPYGLFGGPWQMQNPYYNYNPGMGQGWQQSNYPGWF